MQFILLILLIFLFVKKNVITSVLLSKFRESRLCSNKMEYTSSKLKLNVEFISVSLQVSINVLIVSSSEQTIESLFDGDFNPGNE